MKNGVVIVNTGRGKCIVEEDLAEALDERQGRAPTPPTSGRATRRRATSPAAHGAERLHDAAHRRLDQGEPAAHRRRQIVEILRAGSYGQVARHRTRQEESDRWHAHYNFYAGPAALPAARPGAGPARAARLRRHRHVGDGDQPPLQGVRRGPQRGDRARQGAARRSPTTTRSSSSRAAASLQFAHGADEPARRRARPPTTSSPAPGRRRRSRRPSSSATSTLAFDGETVQAHARPAAGRAEAHARRALRPLHHQQHDRGHAVARASPRPAACRSSCDMSSDFLWRPFDVKPFGLIYAGAQKNLGPAGVTRRRSSATTCSRSARTDIPTMLNYKTHAKENSLYNTPPLLRDLHRAQRARATSRRSAAWRRWRRRTGRRPGCSTTRSTPTPTSSARRWRRRSRSFMNVVFRLPSEELEAKFVAEAKKRRMLGLKGHRSVGGIRVSIYNACPMEAVEAVRRVHEGVRQGERVAPPWTGSSTSTTRRPAFPSRTSCTTRCASSTARNGVNPGRTGCDLALNAEPMIHDTRRKLSRVLQSEPGPGRPAEGPEPAGLHAERDHEAQPGRQRHRRPRRPHRHHDGSSTTRSSDRSTTRSPRGPRRPSSSRTPRGTSTRRRSARRSARTPGW